MLQPPSFEEDALLIVVYELPLSVLYCQGVSPLGPQVKLKLGPVDAQYASARATV